MNCATWSSEVLIPNCVFGTCQANNTCLCAPGFQNDNVLGHFDNCALPTWAPKVFFSLAMVLCLISFSYSLIVFAFFATKRSTLGRACLTAAISSFTFILALISLISQEFSMPWYGALFTSLGAVTSAHLAGLILQSVLSPVAASQRLKSTHHVERFFLYGIPGFMLFCICFCIGFGFAWNEIALGMGFVYATVAVCALVALPFLFWFPTLLIRALNTSLSMDKNNVDTVAKLTVVLFKVKMFRLTSCVCAFVSGFVCLLASGIQFAHYTLPLSWVLFFAFVMGLSVFHVQVAHFAKPAKAANTTSARESFDQFEHRRVSMTNSPTSRGGDRNAFKSSRLTVLSQ